jgi:cell division protein ZapA|tara:strand:+ start:875 stop:1189 length:315 start_codon:yes stop_codon:yes gene_type:complete
MDSLPEQVTIKILEKEYKVSCQKNEKNDLLASADLLNIKMKEIRDSGKVVGLDRVAVMAALNLANELIQKKDERNNLKDIVESRIKSMSESLDSAIASNQQLSI